MSIILASASPRRRELLKMLGIEDFHIIPAPEEKPLSPGDAGKAVQDTALDKAMQVKRLASTGDIIIAADTVVCVDNMVLGKPKDEGEAFKMLSSLSGRSHFVYTGVAVISGDYKDARFEKTEVFFKALTPGEINRYIATGEPMDKAGAYGIQGRGSVFISGICGDYFNVVGLPVSLLWEMLKPLKPEGLL